LFPKIYVARTHAEPTQFALPDTTEHNANVRSALVHQVTLETLSTHVFAASAKPTLNAPIIALASTTRASIHVSENVAPTLNAKPRVISQFALAQAEPAAMRSSHVVSRRAIQSPGITATWTSS
jgi:hypothetical protein